MIRLTWFSLVLAASFHVIAGGQGDDRLDGFAGDERSECGADLCSRWIQGVLHQQHAGNAEWNALVKVVERFSQGLMHRPDGVVLDVGGHLGAFSELLANTPAGRSLESNFIFEPVRELHLFQLKRLRNTNKLFRFENLAFGAQDWDVKTIHINPLQVPESGGIPGGFNTLLDQDPKATSDEWKESFGKERVVIRTLSNFVHERGIADKVVGIKIDVEGFEGQVLKGALPWFRALHAQGKPLPTIQVKAAWGSAHPEFDMYKIVLNELHNLGLCTFYNGDTTHTVDFLFKPKKLEPSCEYNPVI